MNLDRLCDFGLRLGVVVALAALVGCAHAPAGTFATPEEAVEAIAEIAGTGDSAKAEELFGPSGAELLQSGDIAADREDALQVKALILEKVAFEDPDPDTRIALLGDEGWQFPMPLVQEKGRWRFDAEQGREELLNRRIGNNELLALASLHAYVDAQGEYRAGSWDGKPHGYARRFLSSPDQHDGLYWPAAEDQYESPLGPLYAEADTERAADSSGPQPFHGYYFRILESQGPRAPGGAHSYVDEKGLMTRGFAAVAWPAKYGNSGIMTFLVNQQGIVFQKDLGPETETTIKGVQTYEPDSSWAPTRD